MIYHLVSEWLVSTKVAKNKFNNKGKDAHFLNNMKSRHGL